MESEQLQSYALVYGTAIFALFTLLAIGNVLVVRVISTTEKLKRSSSFDLMRLLAAFDSCGCVVFFMSNALFVILHLYGKEAYVRR